MSADATTAIVPAGNGHGPPRSVHLATFFKNVGEGMEVSTFDPSKEADAVPYLNAVSMPATQLKSCVGDTIEVCHVVARNVELVNEESGEVVNGVRLVMVGPDGQLWSTTSEPVIRTVSAVFNTAFGPPPWNPAMRFRIKQSPGRGQRMFLSAETLGRAPATAEPAPKKK